jgi:hypothetical protein
VWNYCFGRHARKVKQGHHSTLETWPANTGCEEDRRLAGARLVNAVNGKVEANTHLSGQPIYQELAKSGYACAGYKDTYPIKVSWLWSSSDRGAFGGRCLVGMLYFASGFSLAVGCNRAVLACLFPLLVTGLARF